MSVPDQIGISLFSSGVRRTYLCIMVSSILMYLNVNENNLTEI